MNTVILVSRIFCAICLLLLPITVFRRTWMFRVGITKKDHRTTKLLMLVWMLAGLFAAGLFCIMPILRTARPAPAAKACDSCAALRRENAKLKARTEKAETAQAKLMKSGTHYVYDGSMITVKYYKGRETKIFERLIDIRNREDWRELAAVAERQITRTPKWLTPYLFLGQAQLEMGKTNEALANLKHVSEAAPLDPSYRLVHELLSRID